EDLHSRWNGDTWIWWERELFSYLTVTAVEPYDIKMVPMKLFNNYPNPFDLNTTISYLISKPGSVVLKIYNSTGEEIETLVHENQLPGHYNLMFIPHNMPAGIYLYSLQYDNFTLTKKMILVK
ncbi:MAG: T9SS type A sorting domain-containing protein, partial [Bacteroidales bacterium]|nr:T9SS type A sorting domain-containing protein [Bacteroidales bacterium]